MYMCVRDCKQRKTDTVGYRLLGFLAEHKQQGGKKREKGGKAKGSRTGHAGER